MSGHRDKLLFLALLSTVLPIALYLPFLYLHLWLLAAILFFTQGGQAIAALIMVLVPAESVPPQFSATAIALATLVGEIIGATIAPAAGGAMAERFGLQVDAVRITGVNGPVFHAEVALSGPSGSHTVECRPSDALALALRQPLPVPIMVAEEVLATAGRSPGA